ncbi:Vegetative incompatibility protein HET-E-1 [Apiospora marii]|uniref:Vegetative incompatibility protein HET-E-1 n=1 Tax=Apiospora marii TaxID=335849 RepID=UPI00312DF93D
MEPLSIIALTGNVLQFLEVASKLVSKGRRIHTSPEGPLIDFADTCTTALFLQELGQQLEGEIKTNNLSPRAQAFIASPGMEASLVYAIQPGAAPGQLGQLLQSLKPQDRTDVTLYTISRECVEVSRKLTVALEGLRIHGRRSKWKSMRQAFSSMCGESQINMLAIRLERCRGLLDTTLLLSMRQRANFSSRIKEHCDRTCESEVYFPSDLLTRVEELAQIAKSSQVNAEGQSKSPDTEFSNRVSDWGSSAWLLQQTEEILNSLKDDEKEDREFRIVPAHAATFKWIFDSNMAPHPHTERTWSSMSTWLEADQDVYWITGKPGSGKSTLVKFLASHKRTMHHLRKWAGATPLVVASFYFWNSGSVAQMSQLGLLRSLIHDILAQRPELVPKVLPGRLGLAAILGRNTREFQFHELIQAFERILECARDTFKLCLFIDGLDEFDGDHETLVEMFAHVVSHPNVKACLASRPWLVFEDALLCKPHLELHHLTYPDIVRFTTARFHANKHFQQLLRRDPAKEDVLIGAVARRSSGVFLWVELATKSLLNGLRNHDRLSDLQRRLEDVPPDLEGFYEKIFSSIEPLYLQHACQYLQITRVARGKLTAIELWFTDEDMTDALNGPNKPLDEQEKLERQLTIERRLKSRCKGLLEMTTFQQPETSSMDDESTQEVLEASQDSTTDETCNLESPIDGPIRISYLHRTARDFLEDKRMVRKIRSSIKGDFCPISALFHASILLLKTFSQPVTEANRSQLWELIDRSLSLAAMKEEACDLPQTRLLELIDEVVSELTQCAVSQRTTRSRDAPATAEHHHWTTGSRLDPSATAFADLAAKYQMPLYMLETIQAALPEGTEVNPDRDRCLFHVVRDYSKQAGLCEWVGHRVPRLSFVHFLLDAGANPNKAFSGITAFEIVLSESVAVSNDDNIPDRVRVLEYWSTVVEIFLRHDANPRTNRASQMGSWVREAFGIFLPHKAKSLESSIMKRSSKWSEEKRFIVPSSTSTVIELPMRPTPPDERCTGNQSVYSRTGTLGELYRPPYVDSGVEVPYWESDRYTRDPHTVNFRGLRRMQNIEHMRMAATSVPSPANTPPPANNPPPANGPRAAMQPWIPPTSLEDPPSPSDEGHPDD